MRKRENCNNFAISEWERSRPDRKHTVIGGYYFIFYFLFLNLEARGDRDLMHAVCVNVLGIIWLVGWLVV